MKRFFTLSVLLFTAFGVFAQAPQKMSYQCVVRDAGGGLITSQSVGLRISILQGSATGELVYQETFSPNPQTNSNGLLSIEIGGGTPVTGTFSDIDWASGPYFLKTETDPDGGTNYTIVGSSQLLSVPYALNARTAENGFSGNYEDLAGKPSLTTVATTGRYDDLIDKPIINNSQWTANGNNIYYNSGSVSIGDAKPESFANLSICGREDYANIFLYARESISRRLSLGMSSYASVLMNYGDTPLIFGTNGIDRLRIEGNGYVGIGTQEPEAGLHLRSNSWPGSFIYLQADAGGDAGMRFYQGQDVKWHIFNSASAGGLLIQNNGINTAIFCEQSSSNVGIGTTTPFFKLTVNGTAWCSSGAWTGSDIRWKKNISEVTNSLSGLLGLKAVSYDLKRDEFPEMGFENGRQIGLIAQDVEKIFPDLVKTDGKGYKSVSYEKLSVLLVEGMKEQQKQIDQLKKEIELLKSGK